MDSFRKSFSTNHGKFYYTRSLFHRSSFVFFGVNSLDQRDAISSRGFPSRTVHARGNMATAPGQFPMRQHHNLRSGSEASFHRDSRGYRVVVLACAIGRCLSARDGNLASVPVWQRIISTSMSRVPPRLGELLVRELVTLCRSISSKPAFQIPYEGHQLEFRKSFLQVKLNSERFRFFVILTLCTPMSS